MELNVLKPKEAVESAFKKPNMLAAFVLVLLPPLASIAGRMLYGVDVSATAVSGIVLSYVGFFVLALVVFVLGLLLNAKQAKKSFTRIFSALALVQIAALALVVLSVAALPLVVSPGAIAAAAEASHSASDEMAVLMVNDYFVNNPGAVNMPALIIFTVISLIVALFGLYLIFLCVKKATESGSLMAVLLTAIALIVVGALPV